MTDPNSGGPYIDQDVFIEGGRCAWAIERLLDCSLPEFTEDVKAEDKPALIQRAACAIIEAMRMPEELDLKALSVEDRIALAVSKETKPKTLGALAEDPDVRVRKAAAANLRTPLQVIARMADSDPDPEVRGLANWNLEHARTLQGT